MAGAVSHQPATMAEALALPAQLLAGLPPEAAGAWHPDAGANHGVALRAWPWPYRSALAVSNDCDSQNLVCFRDWHGFVNGSKPTAYGDGLGLEVGDSYWVYGIGSEPSLLRGTPFDADPPDSPALPTIVELGRAGWLDTLHSFGNWLLPAADKRAITYARDQMRRGLDKLDALGLKPSVYVNHSGSPSNVGGPWASYQRVDDPSHPLHSLDALTAFGLRFFWLDACTDIEKFGNELAFDDAATLARAVESFGWSPWLRRKLDGRTVPIVLPEDEVDRRALLVAMFNRAQFPLRVGDGRLIHAFKRFRDIDQPVGTTFACQVTGERLDALEAAGGCVVIYQHFGVFGPRGRSPAMSRAHRRRSPVPALDAHTVATWELIAERQRTRRLFVATVGRLMDWIWRRTALRFTVTPAADHWVVSLDRFECPVEGARAVGDADLAGLALSVPADAPRIEVVRPGRAGTVAMARTAAGDGRDVIYRDWSRLEWPE